MKSNHIARGFWIIFLASIWILAYPFIHERIPALRDNFQSYSMNLAQDSIPLSIPDSLLAEDTLIASKSGLDSLPLTVELSDSMLLSSIDSTGAIPPPPGPYSGIQHLLKFYEALKLAQSGQRKCRIAYFGDSLIEGDLITETLREELQKLFKGQGVGFVPLTSLTPGFRRTIQHSFSKDWEAYSFLQPNSTEFDFGISGEVFINTLGIHAEKDLPWVEYEGTPLFENTKEFKKVKLYYGKSTDSLATYLDNQVLVSTNDTSYQLKLNPSKPVNELVLCNFPTQKVNLQFKLETFLPVFGVSFEQDHGVFIDNFASRGNSGLTLIEINPQILSNFQKHLKYDLVVLHYGLNVANPKRKSFNNYAKGMKRVIDYFKEHMPDTDLMIVSVSDRSLKINGTLQTDPSVPLLVRTQRNMAKESNIGFVNLYGRMGGINSMIDWTEAGLGTKDYAHFSREGATKVGKILYDYLMEGLNYVEAVEQMDLALEQMDDQIVSE